MISLIIPAFNEAEALERLLPRLPAAVDGIPVHPLVVSDGSTDDTVAVATRNDVPVLALAENRGKGSAIRAALEANTSRHFDVVVFMDADGQHRPEDLCQLVAPVLSGQADLALGSRYIRDRSRRNTPLNRYLVRTGTVAVLRMILAERFSDPYCGFRALTSFALDRVTICGERYEGELEVLFDACRNGLRTVEVPIERIYGSGTSKMASDGGRFIGRVRVLRQYVATIIRKTREAQRARALSPIPIEEPF
jgi:glycosyltransferase involved in cell wall biosynthesis